MDTRWSWSQRGQGGLGGQQGPGGALQGDLNGRLQSLTRGLLRPLGESAGAQDAHSLVIDLTVQSQSRPGQPWCEGQGSMDKELILQYDSDSNEVRPLGPLGEKLKTTTVWTELPQMLGDMGRDLRMILPVISVEGNKTRVPPLQSSASPPSTQKNISSIISGIFGSIFISSLSLGVWLWKSGRMKALCHPCTTSQGPSVETIRDVGGEELNSVSGGSPAELVGVSGADPEVTRTCGESLLPKSSCSFELIP
ncbi:uncharacterized protein LOC118978984 isoform X4 [Sturnira hondurensis]|uniref:uncharacterized protein LOC118978984 isoform X4 n=1 Tax=Sturnira hondurensis TaxID=192404 RepID=UPI001879AFE9|nr:uncharacterized protein LOC118978984 isoform X4 [Sturnira hondurensis]